MKASQNSGFVGFFFFWEFLYTQMHKNNGKEHDVKCVKEMAGIQWERCALHTWQEEGREQHL